MEPNFSSLGDGGFAFTNPVNLCDIALDDVNETYYLHMVSKEDTLQGLALRHRMSVGTMQRENQILGNFVHSGQNLRIHKKNACNQCIQCSPASTSGSVEGDGSQDYQGDHANDEKSKFENSELEFQQTRFSDSFDGLAPKVTVFAVEEEGHNLRHLPLPSVEEEQLRPVKLLRGPSEILSEKEIQQIEAMVLPEYWQGYNWELMYSVIRDGSMYLQFFESLKHTKPTLIVIQTTCKEVFGGFVTSEWEAQTGYYGTGECFLWKMERRKDDGHHEETSFFKYPWTRANSFFMYCQENCFGMGGGGGHFGFLIGDDMEQGSTGPTATFGNEMLCSESKFDIMDIEIWTFTAQSDQLKANLERLRMHFRNKAGTNRLYI
mmetsp:Transcript_2265/g.3143  ORF Transcript_2265/g.3143 Transcript_2265/m.3143 type:complete len:377 (+) Transcript_2265:102-1232(+)